MATTRHWTIQSSNDEHNLVGNEEQHILIGRRVQSVERNVIQALGEMEERQREAIGALGDAHHQEVESFKAIQANELRAFRDLHARELSGLNARLSTNAIELSGSLDGIRQHLTERIDAARDGILDVLDRIENRRWSELQLEKEQHANALASAKLEYDREVRALCTAHDAELARMRQTITSLTTELVTKKTTLTATEIRARRWTTTALVSLFLSAVATVGVLLR